MHEEQGVVEPGNRGATEGPGKATCERRQNPAAYRDAQKTLRRAIRRAKSNAGRSSFKGPTRKSYARRWDTPHRSWKGKRRCSSMRQAPRQRAGRNESACSSEQPSRDPQTRGNRPHYRTEDTPTSESLKLWSDACWQRRETQAPPEETEWGRK